MQTNNMYNREELQELLADFALGNLPEQEANKVQLSLQNYPDLLDDVDTIVAVFSKFDKQKVISSIDYQTRNLSVHVNKQISQQSKPTLLQIIFGRIVPVTLGIAVILLVVIKFTSVTTGYMATIDEDISQAILHDTSMIKGIQSGLTEPTFGSPSPEATSALSDTARLSDNLDELLAESIISSTTEHTDPDFIETEKLQLQNKVDIDDIELMIQELNDDAG